MTIQLFNKIYTFDTLNSLEQDISECFSPVHNAAVVAIPEDENNQKMGIIRVRVDWIDG